MAELGCVSTTSDRLRPMWATLGPGQTQFRTIRGNLGQVWLGIDHIRATLVVWPLGATLVRIRPPCCDLSRMLLDLGFVWIRPHLHVMLNPAFLLVSRHPRCQCTGAQAGIGCAWRRRSLHASLLNKRSGPRNTHILGMQAESCPKWASSGRSRPTWPNTCRTLLNWDDGARDRWISGHARPDSE